MLYQEVGGSGKHVVGAAGSEPELLHCAKTGGNDSEVSVLQCVRYQSD